MPDEPLASRLLQQAEPMVALSTVHLSPQTRQLLAGDALSVPAYPNDYGGFVHVANLPEVIPAEPDLAAIFVAARRAGLIWLKFDADAGIVDGLPVFDDSEPPP